MGFFAAATTVNSMAGITDRMDLSDVMERMPGNVTLAGRIRSDEALALTEDTKVDMRLVFREQAYIDGAEITTDWINIGSIPTSSLNQNDVINFSFDLAKVSEWRLCRAVDIKIYNIATTEAKTVEAHILRGK